MRPRRRVALYSRDEHGAGVLAYMLRLRLRLDVTRCATADELAAADCGLAVLVLTESGEAAGLRELCRRPHPRSMVYDPQSLSSEAECGAVAYLGGETEPARLLEQVRALLVVRRGPKRQPGKHGVGIVSTA